MTRREQIEIENRVGRIAGPIAARQEDRSGPAAARREEFLKRTCWKTKPKHVRGYGRRVVVLMNMFSRGRWVTSKQIKKSMQISDSVFRNRITAIRRNGGIIKRRGTHPDFEFCLKRKPRISQTGRRGTGAVCLGDVPPSKNKSGGTHEREAKRLAGNGR